MNYNKQLIETIKSRTRHKYNFRRDWKLYLDIPDEEKNNYEICKSAAEQCGFLIKFMKDEYKNDFEICKLAAESDGESIQYMSDEMRNNEEICKIAMLQNVCAIKFMSDEMKNNMKLCIYGNLIHNNAIHFISDEMKNNKLFKIRTNPELDTQYNYKCNQLGALYTCNKEFFEYGQNDLFFNQLGLHFIENFMVLYGYDKNEPFLTS